MARLGAAPSLGERLRLGNALRLRQRREVETRERAESQADAESQGGAESRPARESRPAVEGDPAPRRARPSGPRTASEARPSSHTRGEAGGSELDPEADPESVGRAILIRKLAAQDRTRHELATALTAKNVPDEVAEGLLERFEELGLVDDEAFAQRWVESRQTRRHRSRLALRRELAGKGVERDTIDDVLSSVSTEDELEAARAYAEKVSSSLSGLDQTVRRRRLTDRLARRGFGYGVISRVLKDLGLG